MILTELLNEDTLIRHYSDSNFYLLQNETGIKYADPIDIIPCPYTYTETDELIPIPKEKNKEKEEND
jgi:hypothetical protein